MNHANNIPVIKVRDLRMRYGTTDVLTGVDLELRRGEVLALLGPNGAGKTTTIEILTGFRNRSSGHVTVLGADPEHTDEAWKARLGIVLQSWRDHRRWRVRELLHHMGSYYASFSTELRLRPFPADELLELVGLTAQARKRTGTLSGGQRRRLDVAIGLVGNPELLFLDEPTVGFDPVARREFHQMIQKLSSQRKTSIVLTTHDLAEAEKLSDTIAVLINGRIAAHDTVASLATTIAGCDQISFELDGKPHSLDMEPGRTIGYVRHLVNSNGSRMDHLEIRRATLEDAYLRLVSGEDSIRHRREDDSA